MTLCDGPQALLAHLQTGEESATDAHCDVALCSGAELTDSAWENLVGPSPAHSRPIPIVLLVDLADETAAARALASSADEVLLRDPQDHYLKILPAVLARAVARHRFGASAAPTATMNGTARLADLERLALVVEQLPASLWATDRDLRFELIDGQKWRSVKDESPYRLGLTLQECLGNDGLPIEMYRRALAGEHVNYVLPLPKPVSEIHVSPFRDRSGQIIGTVGVAINVTSSESTREELRLLNAAIESVTDGILISDETRPDHPIIYASPKFSQLTGYSREETLGRNFGFLHGPDTAPAALAQIRDSLARGEAFHGELLTYRKDGRPFWNELRIRPFHNSDGVLTRFVGSLNDVTERRQAEEALKLSQKRFATAFHASPNALTITRTDDGLIYEINDQCESLLGRPRAEVIGRTTVELNVYADPSERSRLRQIFERDGRIRNHEVQLRSASGEIRPFLFSAAPIEVDGERCLLTTLLDVTELRRAERDAREHLAALAHMNRLVTAVELSSGLAHELNQPLVSIRLHAEVAQGSLTAKEPDVRTAVESLTAVIAQVQRASAIIHMLRSLVRKGETRRSTSSVNELVQNTLFLVEPTLRGAQVQLHVELTKLAPTVLCDAIQISQVLLNLLQNALEALEPIPAEDRGITVTTAIESDKVVIAVSDTGIGLPDGILDQLFGTFFSTKPEGLGLGLAISKSLVEAHAGLLTARRNPGRGATFAIQLPLLAGDST